MKKYFFEVDKKQLEKPTEPKYVFCAPARVWAVAETEDEARAIAADKKGMAKHTEFWRMLPRCEEPICCKVIRNTEARFNNRTRKPGWLTPTANHLLQTHINLVRKIQKILPVSGIVLEINRFDFAKMENPGIRNWEYQKGRLFGFQNVYEAVSYRQNGKCLLCRRPAIEHYHHLVPKHLGGSESIDNYAGLCLKCHQPLVCGAFNFSDRFNS